ncbi:phosphatase PAP2 family protein [Candidatus Omnitrophota bacterium]
MIRDIDIALFHIVNRDLANPAFDTVMPWITALGNGRSVFFIAIGVYFLVKKRAKIAGFVIIAGISASHYIAYYFKNLFGLPRPYEILQGARVLVDSSGFAFPSGHTTMAFTAAFIINAFVKKPLMIYAVAAAVGFSRVYLGVHFPSDVASGMLLGTLIGYILVTGAGKAGAFDNIREVGT